MDRDPEYRTISEAAYNSRVIVGFTLAADLEYIDLTVPSVLRELGADGAVFGSPYATTQVWANALMRHPSSPAGLIYESRLNPGKKCLALFERPGVETKVTAEILHPMADDPEVRVAMIRERIGVSPPSP